MEQIEVSFTSAWIPALWLSPTVDIWERDGTKRISGWVCNEIAWGRYIYNFDGYQNDKNYMFTFDWWSSLADSDRYKQGSNDLDSYSSKYSRGRTAIPTTNYTPNFQKLEKQLKETKYPTYNDSELKSLISSIGTLVSSKTDDSVLGQIATLQSQLWELNKALSESSTTNISKLSEEMGNLNNNLETLKENIWEMVRATEDNVATKLEDVHGRLAGSMDEKLNPDYLSKHIGKPVEDLQRKVEELFVAQVQKNVPENILNQFDIKLIKKDDTNALKQLESMIENV